MTPIEQLRAALEDPGPNPELHERIFQRTRRDWPSLMRAVDRVLEEEQSCGDHKCVVRGEHQTHRDENGHQWTYTLGLGADS